MVDFDNNFSDIGVGELRPGATKRRWEPECGINKHNERIHKESKQSDGSNLPFSFRKPLKSKGSFAIIKCNNCGNITSGSTITVGIICKKCGKYSSVTEVEL